MKEEIEDAITAENLKLLRMSVDEKFKHVKPRKMGNFLTEGFAWNPMKAWPRNEACFCLSGIKFKKCCMPNLRECIAEAEVPKMKSLVDKMHLLRKVERSKA